MTGAPQPVELPSLGVKAWVQVRLLDDKAEARVRAYLAGIKGPGGDRATRTLAAMVRYVLVGSDGEPLCRNFAEAERLLAALDIEDLNALAAVLRPMIRSLEAGKVPAVNPKSRRKRR